MLESVGVSASTSDPAHPEQEVKIEEKLKENRNRKENFSNKDSDDEFIDDKEASEDEDWSEEDDSPPKKQGKARGRKTTSSIVKKWNEWAELLVTDDDGLDRLVNISKILFRLSQTFFTEATLYQVWMLL